MDWWNAVSSWYQGSVFSLHFDVRCPSQSTSMSAFQNTAPFLPHTGIEAEVSSSVRYLPLESWEQDVTLASRAAALTEPSLTDAVLDVPEAYEGSVAEASRAAPATAPRASVRERTVGGPFC